MTIQPIRDHLLIEVNLPEKETKTPSGFIIQTNTATTPKHLTGKVIALGEGRILNDGTVIPSSVKLDDHVICYDYAGLIVHPENAAKHKQYLLIKQNDILAILADAE